MAVFIAPVCGKRSFSPDKLEGCVTMEKSFPAEYKRSNETDFYLINSLRPEVFYFYMLLGSKETPTDSSASASLSFIIRSFLLLGGINLESPSSPTLLLLGDFGFSDALLQ